jgi:hypothetical protein
VNLIKVKPNAFSVFGICSLTLIAVLFTFYYPESHPDPKSIHINWYGLFFLTIPVALLVQLKSVKIADGKIRIVYLLRRRQIMAPVEMIQSVKFISKNPEAKKYYTGVVVIEFKNNKSTRVIINGYVHANMEKLEEYIKVNFPQLVTEK